MRMTVSVEFASVLAQVAPVFLLMLLFERMYFGRAERSARYRFVTFGHVVRYASAMLCFLVFATGLLIVGLGRPVTGWVGAVIFGIIGVLVVMLWATLHLSLDALRERALEDLDADTESDGVAQKHDRDNDDSSVDVQGGQSFRDG